MGCRRSKKGGGGERNVVVRPASTCNVISSILSEVRVQMVPAQHHRRYCRADTAGRAPTPVIDWGQRFCDTPLMTWLIRLWQINISRYQYDVFSWCPGANRTRCGAYGVCMLIALACVR